ncbi:ras GEF [Basidiobolus meristosporus CBS 931.73]|uniref:Ras GEF n=1 Tax=Basidiobolus meristosporus CBS 931.73 TaxID=1314790 RepID=A0A1Y1ZCJ3_9FUNG|nr:ras GEF [Basidiobolus meristosporus CBS 931.73]|eukprot:ORY07992.1 ras GEF [Basidiobolus meristosporus CBS 931.73]
MTVQPFPPPAGRRQSDALKNRYSQSHREAMVFSSGTEGSLLNYVGYSQDNVTQSWDSLSNQVKLSVLNLEKSSYILQAHKIHSSIYNLLNATDLLYWNSPVFKIGGLSGVLHQLVGEMNWLIILCKLAESAWPPKDIIPTLRVLSKDLLQTLKDFISKAKENEVQVRPPHVAHPFYQLNNNSSDSIFRRKVELQPANYDETNFIYLFEQFSQSLLSEITSIKETEVTSSEELVASILLCIDSIGTFLCLVEILNLPNPGDPVLTRVSEEAFLAHHNYIQKKIILYADINELVTSARAVLFSFVQDNARLDLDEYVSSVISSTREAVQAVKHLLGHKEIVKSVNLFEVRDDSDDPATENELDLFKRRVDSLKEFREENEFFSSSSDSDFDRPKEIEREKLTVNEGVDDALGRTSFSSTSSAWSCNTQEEAGEMAKERRNASAGDQLDEKTRLSTSSEQSRSSFQSTSSRHTNGDTRSSYDSNRSSSSIMTQLVLDGPVGNGPKLPKGVHDSVKSKSRKRSVFDLSRSSTHNNRDSTPTSVAAKLSLALGFNSSRRPSLPAVLPTGLFSSDGEKHPKKGFFRKKSSLDQSSDKKSQLNNIIEERRGSIECKNDEWFLDYDYDPADVVFSPEGQLLGGTIEALVERLTLHDTTIDSDFVNVFLLTFRNFCKPKDFCNLLLARFNMSTPDGLSESEYENWRLKKLTPIRLRVHNILKTWLESYFYEDEDYECLQPMLNLAEGTMKEMMASSAERLANIVKLKMETLQQESPDDCKPSSLRLGNSKSVDRLMAAAMALVPDTPPPPSILSKTILDSLADDEPICITDIEPLEVARQLTIMDSRLFRAIRPHELIGQEFSKKEDSLSVNVRMMSKISTQITEWVAHTILQEEDVRKRLGVLKHFIMIAEKCYTLNNFNTLMAIMCGLNSSMIARLKKTWSLLPGKHEILTENLRRITDHTRNYSEYRKQLKESPPPCLPFLGIYLTDLTFTDDGNRSFRRNNQVINFNKHVKTVRIIQEVQHFQVPYNLADVVELQDYLNREIEACSGWDPNELYELSLKREPRQESGAPSLRRTSSFCDSTTPTNSAPPSPALVPLSTPTSPLANSSITRESISK